MIQKDIARIALLSRRLSRQLAGASFRLRGPGTVDPHPARCGQPQAPRAGAGMDEKGCRRKPDNGFWDSTEFHLSNQQAGQRVVAWRGYSRSERCPCRQGRGFGHALFTEHPGRCVRHARHFNLVPAGVEFLNYFCSQKVPGFRRGHKRLMRSGSGYDDASSGGVFEGNIVLWMLLPSGNNA